MLTAEKATRVISLLDVNKKAVQPQNVKRSATHKAREVPATVRGETHRHVMM